MEVQITCERIEQKEIELLYAELALGRPQLSTNLAVRCRGPSPALQIFLIMAWP